MRIKAFLFFAIFASLLSTAHATSIETSSLFVKDDGKLLDVQDLIDKEVEIQTSYGFENFCYRGNPTGVMRKMSKWAKSSDLFFSGGGGGFMLKKLKLIRGFATYDILMTLADEVAPGEFKRVFIKPCK